MRHLYYQPFRTAVSYLSIGLLTASSFAYAQAAPAQDNSAQPPADQQQQQQTAPNGGWRRVGDPTPQDQNQPTDPNYTANQAPANPPDQPADENANQAPPQPPPQNSVPQQNGPYAQGPAYGSQAGPGYGPGPAYGQQGAPGYGAAQGPYSQQGYPQAPYPTYQQPSYPAPPPIPAQVTVPAGTFITVRVNQMLSSDKNQQGDPFTAQLVEPVVANGIVIAEPGQTLSGRVEVAEKHSAGHPARLGVQLTTLTAVDGQPLPVSTELTARKGPTTPGGVEAGTIVATTGLGAAVGAAAGWGRGAAIGAGAGLLVGVIGVVVTHNHPSVIHPEQILTFRLEAPVTVNTQNSQAFRYVEPGEYDRPQMAGGPYQSYVGGVAPVPAPYAYGYPYYGYGYGYPAYWGPGVGVWFGPGWYGGRYYGRGFYGGRGGFRR